MKKIILLLSFCLSFSMLQAQENAIRITKANEKDVVIKENRRIRIKIEHPKKNRLKKISGQFRFSKNKDSIFIRNNFLAKKHKVAINDILKIKRHPLTMSMVFSASTVILASISGGAVFL